MYNLKMDLQHDFIHNAVIPPPNVKPDFEIYKKFTRVVIDSKDRDKELFPNANDYEIRFDDDIEDVLNVQLISMDVSLNSYLINSYFNTFTLIYNNTTYQVELDKGDYDTSGLATMVTNKLNSLVPATFVVEYNSKLDNFVFKATAAFQISFVEEKNSIEKIFGFDKREYTSSASGTSPWPHVIQAPFRRDFKFNNYLIINIDQFDINKSSSNDLNRSFAIVTASYDTKSISDDPHIKKYFSPPLARLNKIRVKINDRYGNPYDFGNTDHFFELMFESMKQKRKYQNIFFNR
jgi:hypothetical protein